MCELFGMSSAHPATVSLSFGKLAEHGGGTAHHRDGWGLGFFSGRDAQLFREASPAASSPLACFLAESGARSQLVIAHVRKATMGKNSLVNTQPFMKDIGGRLHLFAHNGRFDDIASDMEAPKRKPIGDTDSEQAFCALSDALEALWANEVPSVEARVAVVQEFAARMRDMGPANFLLSDGELLFAHANKRTQKDGSMASPGMVMVERKCGYHPSNQSAVVQFSEEVSQHVVLFASVPLTEGEAWRPLDEGELVVVKEGQVLKF